MRDLITILYTVLLLVTPTCILEASALDQYLWVPNFYDNTVSKVDVNSHTVEATIPVGTKPAGIAVGRDFVYVTHRRSSFLYRISKATDAVYDSIDLGGVMAFPIGVATDREGYIFVVGRRHFDHLTDPDSAFLAKLNLQGAVDTSIFLEMIDPHAEDVAMRRIGIGLSSKECGFVPWTRAWDSHTGVIEFNTYDLSITNYPISHHFYRGPGVGIDTSGNGWTAGCREDLANITELAPGLGLTHYDMPGDWQDRRGDVVVDIQQSIWVSTITGLFKLIPETQQVDQFAVGAAGGGLACDINGYIWATFPDSNKVKKFDLSGNQVGSSVEVGNYPLGYGDMTGYELGWGPTVPTLSQWGIIWLATMIAISSIWIIKRRKRILHSRTG